MYNATITCHMHVYAKLSKFVLDSYHIRHVSRGCTVYVCFGKLFDMYMYTEMVYHIQLYCENKDVIYNMDIHMFSSIPIYIVFGLNHMDYILRYPENIDRSIYYFNGLYITGMIHDGIFAMVNLHAPKLFRYPILLTCNKGMMFFCKLHFK